MIVKCEACLVKLIVGWVHYTKSWAEDKAITKWNRRFVCLDKTGDKVFAGDRIKRVPYTGDPNPLAYQTEGRTGTVAWHYGFLQWCFLDDKTQHMDDLVDSEIFEDGIDLIKEGT